MLIDQGRCGGPVSLRAVCLFRTLAIPQCLMVFRTTLFGGIRTYVGEGTAHLVFFAPSCITSCHLPVSGEVFRISCHATVRGATKLCTNQTTKNTETG